MRIIWIGFHLEGIPAFKALIEERYTITSCISLNEEQKKKRSGAVDYETIAKNNNIKYIEIKHINERDSINLIKEQKPDLLIVLGWSQILCEEILQIPTIGTIGAHASLLPAYRGSAPINWAIINGLQETGNTLIWLNSGVDNGDIIDQVSFPIHDTDTCATLYDKVAESNKKMLLRKLPEIRIKGKIGYPQPQINQPLLPRRRPSDGLVDFNLDANDVYNFIRALTYPYPGAFAFHEGEKVLIWRAGKFSSGVLKCNSSADIGDVVEHILSPDLKQCGLVVKCKSGIIILNDIENKDGKLITGHELIKRFKIGSKFNP